MKTIVAILFLTMSGFTYAQDSEMAGASQISSGKKVYQKYCSKCHGKNADGRGKKAYKYKPMPTDFHIAQAPRAYMLEIINKGGKGVGRSDNMPSWEGDISDKKIQHMVSYLMSIRPKSNQ